MPMARSTRLFGIATAAAVAVMAGWSGATAENESPARASDEQRAGEGALAGAARFREGATLVDQAGVFQLAGSRVVFISDGDNRQLIALENLALERVARAVREATSTPRWLATGTVTEYHGANFLLLERAIIRRSAPEASAR